MNQQILKLASSCFPRDGDSNIHATPEIIAEFAELIVRECINEIYAADVGDLKGKSYYLDKVAEHLEKHFGVLE